MIDLTNYWSYNRYAENNGGLQGILGLYPGIPTASGQQISFAQLFQGLFGTRYLCYPEPHIEAWTSEAIGMLELYANDFAEKLANLPTIEDKVWPEDETETREIKSAPTGVMSASNYSLGGEVITRSYRLTVDDLLKYREMKPFISEMMRLFDTLFLPVVFGWDDEYPEVVT